MIPRQPELSACSPQSAASLSTHALEPSSGEIECTYHIRQVQISENAPVLPYLKGTTRYGERCTRPREFVNVGAKVGMPRSVDERDDPVRHDAHVLLKVLAIFGNALLLVAMGAVDEEDGEEDRVEEREQPVSVHACQQAP